MAYVSTLVIDQDGEAFREICVRAQAKNAALDITGALYLERAVILQVLEGPIGKVIPLVETISTDPRHTDFHLLNCWEIKDRKFGKWMLKTNRDCGLAALKGPLSHDSANEAFTLRELECIEELAAKQGLDGYS
ncbi:MAG: BLUF domain-containing protein [Pseudomonadota bacterium]